MDKLDGKVAVVTGGSRGLGRGIVDAFAAEGADVWAIARDAGKLDELQREVDGVHTMAADVADPATASRAIGEAHPNLLILNAGVAPRMAPVSEQSWDEFTSVWNNDLKSTFHFCQEALAAPLAPGSVVVIVSSGAAIGGSPLSGGYAGAKRMQWLLSGYVQQEANARDLGIRFVALLPKQIIGGTELGHAAASGYADKMGITKEAFLERQSQNAGGQLLTPEAVGAAVISLVSDPAYGEGAAYGITAQGLELLD